MTKRRYSRGLRKRNRIDDIEDLVFVAFDLETTGLDPDSGDRIIEIGAIPIYRLKIRPDYSFYTLVNPEIKIPGEVSRFHGLKNKDISSAPTLAEVFPVFKNYLGNSVLVSHNAQVDLTFLDFAAKESGEFPINNLYIDTLEISRYFLNEGPFTLESLAKRFGIKYKRVHRAFTDAWITANLFVLLAKRFELRKIYKFVRRWNG